MIVAIESASTDVSIAIAEPGGTIVRADGWSAGHRQAHELLPRIMAALEAHRITLTALSAVAVGLGPGSFTGLRVGMSVAKGLAYALARPIVGVPSLEAWLAAEPDAGGAAARAGARDAYLLQRDGTPLVVDSEALAAFGGTLVAPAELAEAFGLRRSVQPLRAATAVAAAAAASLARGPDGDDLDLLEPTYLRPPRGIGQATGEAR